MAEDPRFLLHFKTKAKFEQKLADGTVSNNRHLCFINDEGLIWCRGKYYADSSKLDNLTSIYNGWSISQSNGSTISITLTGKQWNEGTRQWEDISKTLNLNPATQQVAGLMSAADKTKLDGLNINNVSGISYGTTSTNVTTTITKDNGNAADTSTTIQFPMVSSTQAGAMTAADKVKLDTTIPNQIATETTNRQEADKNLQNQINSLNNNKVSTVQKSGSGAVITDASITGNVMTLDSGDYVFANGNNGTFYVTPPGKSRQTVNVGSINLTVQAVSSLSNIPATTQVVIASISSSQTLTFTSIPSENREIHVLIRNVGSSDINVTLSSSYIIGGDEELLVEAGKYGEVNCVIANGQIFVRGIGS